MVRSKLIAAVSTFAVLAGSTLMPLAAQADGWNNGYNHVQSQKNDARNVAIASAAVGLLGLATHNRTETAIGAIGTVLGASAYEQDRHEQSESRYNRFDDGRFRQSGYDYRTDRGGQRQRDDRR